MHAKLKAVPQEAPDTGPETEAIAIARDCVKDACDALVLLARHDASSADTALKRVMMTAHAARKALMPALLLPPPTDGSKVNLSLGGW